MRDSSTTVVLAPTAWHWMTLCGLLVLGVYVAFIWATRHEQFTTAGNVMLPAGGLAMLVAAIDGAQRRYEISRNCARTRVLSYWRTVDLTPVDTLTRSPLGQLEFKIAAQSRTVFRLPRDYATAKAVKQVEALWHAA